MSFDMKIDPINALRIPKTKYNINNLTFSRQRKEESHLDNTLINNSPNYIITMVKLLMLYFVFGNS